MSDGIIKEAKNSSAPAALTSDKIQINQFKFLIDADAKEGSDPYSSQDDKNQPRITIFLEASLRNQPSQIFKIQTTISQRNLNIK